MLKEGTPAPDFEATLESGERFRLQDQRGRKHVVLYFYPKDFTPGCTREACAFRDNFSEVEQYDAMVIGVSGDAADSHQAFRERHELPFNLIADPGKQVIRLYEAEAFLGLTTARVTYVIDKEGVIRSVFRNDFAAGRHLPHVLETLRSISGAPAS